MERVEGLLGEGPASSRTQKPPSYRGPFPGWCQREPHRAAESHRGQAGLG